MEIQFEYKGEKFVSTTNWDFVFFLLSLTRSFTPIYSFKKTQKRFLFIQWNHSFFIINLDLMQSHQKHQACDMWLSWDKSVALLHILKLQLLLSSHFLLSTFILFCFIFFATTFVTINGSVLINFNGIILYETHHKRKWIKKSA